MIFNLIQKDITVVTGGAVAHKEEEQDEVANVDMTKAELIWRSGQLITVMSFVIGATIFAIYNKCSSVSGISKGKKKD